MVALLIIITGFKKSILDNRVGKGGNISHVKTIDRLF